MTLSVHALSFEVQVPMSQQQAPVMTSQPLTSGQFTTTVNPLDDNGYSYAPGQTPSGPRRVGPIGGGGTGGGGGLPSDPYFGEVVPITDTPWLIMLLLALGYIAFIAYRRRKTSRIN